MPSFFSYVATGASNTAKFLRNKPVSAVQVAKAEGAIFAASYSLADTSNPAGFGAPDPDETANEEALRKLFDVLSIVTSMASLTIQAVDLLTFIKRNNLTTTVNALERLDLQLKYIQGLAEISQKVPVTTIRGLGKTVEQVIDNAEDRREQVADEIVELNDDADRYIKNLERLKSALGPLDKAGLVFAALEVVIDYHIEAFEITSAAAIATAEAMADFTEAMAEEIDITSEGAGGPQTAARTTGAAPEATAPETAASETAAPEATTLESIPASDVPDVLTSDKTAEMPEDIGDALAAFQATWDERVLDRVAAFELAEDLLSLMIALAEDLTPGNVDEWFGQIEDAFGTVSNVEPPDVIIEALDALSQAIEPLSKAASVVSYVYDKIKPVLNVLFGLSSIIDRIIDRVDKAVGLSALRESIETEISEAIEDLFDPITEALDLLDLVDFDPLQDLVDIMPQILDALEVLTEVAQELATQPLGVAAELSGADQQMSGRSQLIGHTGDDQIRLSLDARYDADGLGGYGLGSDGSDTITGTARPDLLVGGTGDDVIFGLAGDDLIFSEAGADQVTAGAGADSVMGGADDDTLYGGDDADQVYGGTGADQVFGGAGDDALFGETGDDYIDAGTGNDTLLGGSGVDTLVAGSGDNVLDGGDGIDEIRTSGDTDATHATIDATARLFGGAGRDSVVLPDDFAAGAVIEDGVYFDGGANIDTMLLGSVDVDLLAPFVENFERLEVISETGETKTMRTVAETLTEFDEVQLVGDGAIVIEIASGDLDMDVVSATQAVTRGFGGMARYQNPQDGAEAGTEGTPLSTQTALTVQLHDAGGRVDAPRSGTTGITLAGGAGDDTLTGGLGSDILRPGLGADIVDGGIGDEGNRFVIYGAVGDVILGTPDDLDGDLINSFSNRVDRVRLTGRDDFTMSFTLGAEDTEVAISDPDSGALLSTFTISGLFPKLIALPGSYVDETGATVVFTEILSNNVPPTAVDDDLTAQFQGEGDADQPIDPFANDFDVDTIAAPEDGLVRRQIAENASLAGLLGLIDTQDEDGARIAFAAGIEEVAEGTRFYTDFGNSLLLTADGLVYDARTPAITVTNAPDSDTVITNRGSGPFSKTKTLPDPALLTDHFSAALDLPFFGLDRISYKVFDVEGELSNQGRIDILVRPDDITLADGGTVPPRVQVTARDGDGTETVFEATLAETVNTATGTARPLPHDNASEDPATALGGNDVIRITQAGDYRGLSGNDVLDARDASGNVGLFGGLNADWLEGGAGDDFLSGGGYDEDLGQLAYRLPDAAFPAENSVAPNILLGGAGDNVFSASLNDRFFQTRENSGDGQERHSVFVLEGGADIVTGPMVYLDWEEEYAGAGSLYGAGGGYDDFGFDLIEDIGPAVLSVLALDNDTVVGFDGDDRIVLPLSADPLNDSSRVGFDFTGRESLGWIFGSVNTEFDITYEFEVPQATGLILTDRDISGLVGGDVLRNDAVNDFRTVWGQEFTRDSFSSVYAQKTVTTTFVPDSLGDPIVETVDIDEAESFSSAPQIISYEISGTTIDNNGSTIPSTVLNVSLREYGVEIEVVPVGDAEISTVALSRAENGFVTALEVAQTFDYVQTVVEKDISTDPGSVVSSNALTFALDLDGYYNPDRFSIEMVHLEELAEAPFVRMSDFPDIRLGADYFYLDKQATAEVTGSDAIGLALRYDSSAPEGVADEAIVRRGNAVVVDVLENDTDADGDELRVFDLVFENAQQEADLLDGDTANGEIVQQIDLDSGFGTGLITFVAPETQTGTFSLGYIAEDGEFQSDVIALEFIVTELPPLLGDDLIVLPHDYADDALDGFVPIALLASGVDDIRDGLSPDWPAGFADTVVNGDILANDSDPDTPETLVYDSFAAVMSADFRPFVDDASASVASLSTDAFARLAADPIGPYGNPGDTADFTYTLTQSGLVGTSDPGLVQVAVAAPFALTGDSAFETSEDTAITLDLTQARTGGYGAARIVEVSDAVDAATGAVLGTVEIEDGAVRFTPLDDLSDVTATITVTVADAIGNQVTRDYTVFVAPVEDDVSVRIVGTADNVIGTDEDTPLAGRMLIHDPDAANDMALEDALAFLSYVADPATAVASAALPALIATRPVPDTSAALISDQGGELTLAPPDDAVSPLLYDFVYTPLEDANGADRIGLALVQPSGATETAEITIDVAAINDAPEFVVAAPEDTVVSLGETVVLDLLLEISDADDVVDAAGLSVVATDSAQVAFDLSDDGLLSIEGLSSGTAGFSFGWTDPEGAATGSREVSLIVNAPPVTVDDTITVLGTGVSVAIDAIANDTDDFPGLAYLLDDDDLPVVTFDPDDVGGTLAWSVAQQTFVYTSPTDPDALEAVDFFSYVVTDAQGQTATGTVSVDLVSDAEAGGTLRVTSGGNDTVQATDLTEQFVLGDGSDEIAGDLSQLNGDVLIDWSQDDSLRILGSSVTILDVTRVYPSTPASAVATLQATTDPAVFAPATATFAPGTLTTVFSPQALFGDDRVEEVTDAFVGTTVLTLTDGVDVAVITLPGLFAGSFAVRTEGTDTIITYGPAISGDGLLTGTPDDDDIYGGAGPDTLIGGDGNDILRGEGGDDDLQGGIGNDVLIGGAGQDLLTGGTGADLFVITEREPGEIGDIFDTIVDFNPSEGDRVVILAADYLNDDLTVDLTLLATDFSDASTGTVALRGTPSTTGAAAFSETLALFLIDPTVPDVGGLLITGSESGEVLNGTDNGEIIDALGGDDTIDAGGGGDLVQPGSGNNVAAGGDGDDTVGFGDQTDDVFVDLARGIARLGGDVSTLTGFENAATGAGNDRLIGDGSGNLLSGGEGDDFLYGDGIKPTLHNDIARQVYRLYIATLKREPDAEGFAGWILDLFEARASLAEIAAGFIDSPEFQTIYGALDDRGFVELLYKNVLGRPGEPAGVQGWLDLLATGTPRAEVVLGFSESPELQSNTDVSAFWYLGSQSDVNWSGTVYRLYLATLDREPDAAGFADWTSQLGSGADLKDEVIRGFMQSPEFQAIIGEPDAETFVRLLYQNVLDRAPSAAELKAWTDRITLSGAERETVVGAFADSPEFIATTQQALHDWIRGLGTDDILEGGSGNNTLVGGMYSDSFVFDADLGGTHIVLDLEPWDSLVFRNFGYADDDAVRANLTRSGADTVFDDQGLTAIFQNTAPEFFGTAASDDLIVV